MFASALSLLSSAASSFATWIGWKKQVADQATGVTMQQDADSAAMIAAASSAQAQTATNDQRTTDDLRAEAMKTASGA